MARVGVLQQGEVGGAAVVRTHCQGCRLLSEEQGDAWNFWSTERDTSNFSPHRRTATVNTVGGTCRRAKAMGRRGSWNGRMAVCKDRGR